MEEKVIDDNPPYNNKCKSEAMPTLLDLLLEAASVINTQSQIDDILLETSTSFQSPINSPSLVQPFENNHSTFYSNNMSSFRPARDSSFSDSCDSSSPGHSGKQNSSFFSSTSQPGFLQSNSYDSRENSLDSNSSLSELMNSLNLSENGFQQSSSSPSQQQQQQQQSHHQSRSHLLNSPRNTQSDLDLLQNLQALQALKILKQSTMLSSLMPTTPYSPFEHLQWTNNTSTGGGSNIQNGAGATSTPSRSASNDVFNFDRQLSPQHILQAAGGTITNNNNGNNFGGGGGGAMGPAYNEPKYTWSGVLPTRTLKVTGYSCKVFLGGVPWDVTEQSLVQTFQQFGPVRVEWPGKVQATSTSGATGGSPSSTPTALSPIGTKSGQTVTTGGGTMLPKGYAYIIFESDKNVRALLQACTTDCINSGNWYYKISSKRMKSKEVQVIPWILNDSNYTKSSTQKLDPSKTVFVGALHGMLNAEGLAKIMNDLFDGVIYTGIDTDKYKYPIGSGRVTFDNPRSYMKAVMAGYIEIKTARFSKRVQVDPYLEDSLCSMCVLQQGPYFCRDMLCYRYFCRSCWQVQHDGTDMVHHRPMTRNSKTNLTVPQSNCGGGLL